MQIANITHSHTQKSPCHSSSSMNDLKCYSLVCDGWYCNHRAQNFWSNNFDIIIQRINKRRGGKRQFTFFARTKKPFVKRSNSYKMSFAACQEPFSESAKLAQKLEVGTLKTPLWRNVWGMWGEKWTLDGWGCKVSKL